MLTVYTLEIRHRFTTILYNFLLAYSFYILASQGAFSKQAIKSTRVYTFCPTPTLATPLTCGSFSNDLERFNRIGRSKFCRAMTGWRAGQSDCSFCWDGLLSQSMPAHAYARLHFSIGRLTYKRLTDKFILIIVAFWHGE